MNCWGRNLEVEVMSAAKEEFQRHIPVLVAFLFLVTGDYLSLIRHVRLLF
jgi:hypothetical protein